MKVIVLADTHLYQVTSELTTVCEKYCADADLVIHLGDWMRAAVLDYFFRFPLEAVAGNMDDGVIRDSLPVAKTITVAGYRIGMAHGWGYEKDMHGLLRRQFPEARIILYGHTHRPLRQQEEGVLFFNPGSLFQGRGRDRGSLGVLNLNQTITADHIPL